ncbi:hypothetical protein OESDEN_04839, partial [Oesophagostomum dentatum]
KIPARYRDDEFETYVKESDRSRASSKLQHISVARSSSHTPEKSRTPSATRLDAVASDVSEVCRTPPSYNCFGSPLSRADLFAAVDIASLKIIEVASEAGLDGQ